MTDETTTWPPSLVATYREQYRDLVRVAYLLVGSQALAEEVVQDSVVAVRDRWSTLASPGGYLRTTVVNRARGVIRRAGVEDRHRPTTLPPGTGTDLVELRASLDRLDERKRSAIVLRYFADLDDAEIADILDCRPGTVRSLISRGLATLRVEIDA